MNTGLKDNLRHYRGKQAPPAFLHTPPVFVVRRPWRHVAAGGAAAFVLAFVAFAFLFTI